MATTLGSQAIGNIVKIKENGTAKSYIVLRHDYPVSGRTLLLREYLLIKGGMAGTKNEYASDDPYGRISADQYFNDTFINTIDSNIRNQISGVNIQYTPGGGNKSVTTLNRKIFLLSYTEVGLSSGSVNTEGTACSYFNSDVRRQAKFEGDSKHSKWWTRTPCNRNDSQAAYVTVSGTGTIAGDSADTPNGLRPAFTLPKTLLVDGSGNVFVNSAPSMPPSLSVPSTIQGGESVPISWGASSDPNGDTITYQLQRRTNGGTYAQIYSGTGRSATDMIAMNAATSAQYRVRAVDSYGATSGWRESSTITVVNNTPPSTPPSITVPTNVVGGQNITITWGASSDAQGNLAGYRLQRSVNGGEWTQIYQGTATSYSDAITKGWNTVAYRVCAYDSNEATSGYQTSPTRTVDNNTAPVISSDFSGNLGTKDAGFSVTYTVTDAENNPVTVVESMDNVQKRSYSVTLGQEQSFDVTGDYFIKLLNGSHTMTIKATDNGGKSSSLTLTFTKAVYSCSITLQEPMDSSEAITKMVMSIAKSIPTDANFQVLVTNNAKDDSPVWEDATQEVNAGLNYVFTNQTATNGFAFNFKIIASRAENGQGGYIESIGGAFE